MTALIISSEKMNNIMKIVKSLEDAISYPTLDVSLTENLLR